jgi:4,5-DOPA dioxygenase extradiol
MLPTLFISHGSPMLGIEEHTVSRFLKNLPTRFEKPKYIIVISAHWYEEDLRILTNPHPGLIYDFYGFPQKLYEVQYPIRNDVSSLNSVMKTLENSHLHVNLDNTRSGYDHGVWVPLSLMYPSADIPVIQLSLSIYSNVQELFQIGEALQSLREEALIIGSGNMTHNIRQSVWDEDAPIKEYAKEFHDWVVQKVEQADIKAFENFFEQAPKIRENHSSLDHLLPFFIALGASKDKLGKSLLDVYMYANQSMDTIIFEG